MDEGTMSWEAACPSGVYAIDAAQRDALARGEAVPAGAVVAVLDEGAATREGFFTEIARELHFPDYFGRNWDAVYDCLTDPSVFPAGGAVIIVDSARRFAANEPEQWQIALRVMHDACGFWRPLSRRLYVLLHRDSRMQ